MPDAVAGHRALELCNTKALWGLPAEKEYLTDFGALVIWAREHVLITAGEARLLRGGTAARQAAALHQIRRFRGALYRALTEPGASLDEVHSYVARAVARSSYRHEAGRALLYCPAAPGMITDRAALDAHRLLEEYGPGSVGRCAGEPCGWLFLDPTHRRRWCVMAVCGNRAKARRFTARQRSG